jgi:hypothetical protein
MMVLIIVHALYSPESTSDITWCTMISLAKKSETRAIIGVGITVSLKYLIGLID